MDKSYIIFEIDKEDMLTTTKNEQLNFENFLILKTKNGNLVFFSFSNVNKSYKVIYDNIIKNKKVESTDINTNQNKENNSNFNPFITIEKYKCEPYHNNSGNLPIKTQSSDNDEPFVGINDLSADFCENIINNTHIVNRNDERVETLSELQFFEKLNNFNKENMERIISKNILQKNFNAVFVNCQPICNKPDLPIHLIYKYIYDNETVINDKFSGLIFKKNFNLSLKELRKDYDITFNYLNTTGENYTDKIPQYYHDFNYTLDLLTRLNKTDLEYFLTSLNDNFDINKRILEFNYKYTHPMKKRFMGPSKLDMSDNHKIYFISPLCFIVELTTHCSGFMLMDNFYTVTQHKYETSLNYDNNLKKITYNTKVTVSFAIEFVKDNWFRNKIESNGLVENEDYNKNFVLDYIGKVLTTKADEYFDDQNKIILSLAKERPQLQSKETIKIEMFENVKINGLLLHQIQEKENEEELNKIQTVRSSVVPLETKSAEKNQSISPLQIISEYTDKIVNLNFNTMDKNNVLVIFICIIVLIFVTNMIFGNFTKELVIYTILFINVYLLKNLVKKVDDLDNKLDNLINSSKEIKHK